MNKKIGLYDILCNDIGMLCNEMYYDRNKKKLYGVLKNLEV